MADMDPEAVKKLKAENRKYRLQLERTLIFLQDVEGIEWSGLSDHIRHNWDLLLSELRSMVGKIPVPEASKGIAGNNE